MLAEFSCFPIGKGESLSKYVAKSLEMIEKSGLAYKLNPMGTVVEGEVDEVFDLIKAVHNRMLEDSDRVATYIKIDDRKGRKDALKKKMESVEEKLEFKPSK